MFKLECLCFSLLLSLMSALAYSQESPIDLYSEVNEVDQEHAEVSNTEKLSEAPADSPDNAAVNSVATEDEISVNKPDNEVAPDSSTAASVESSDVTPEITSEGTSVAEPPAAGSADVNEAAEQSQAEDSIDTTLSESHAATHEEDIDAVNQAQPDAADEVDTPESRTSISEVDEAIQSQPEDTDGKVIHDPSAGTTAKNVSATRVPAAESGIRKGERRPEEQFTIDLFDRPLTIGGSYEAFLYNESDTAFDDGDDEYEYLSHSLNLEFFYEISESVSFFADGVLYYYKDDFEQQSGAERYQTWVYFEEIFDSSFDIKLGAQYFSDDRTWWWDDDLDAISIQYWGDSLQAEVAIVQELARSSTTEDFIDPAEEDLNRLLTRLSWEFSEDHWLEVFYVLQNDHSATESADSVINGNKLDDTDADLQWVGLRGYGYRDMEEYGGVDYWLDTAYMDGDETYISTDFTATPGKLVVDDVRTYAVHGWAFDLGLTWYSEFPLYPSFTIGYAAGSGKLDDQGFFDTAFQQTGLQSNSSYFTDVNYLAYYGQLLYPELSNLKILTIGVSVPLLENSAIDVVYHQYDQYVATDFLRNTGISMAPNGTSKDIGKEIDIIMRALEFVHWEYGITAAFFQAGDAFDEESGEIATSLSFDLRYNF